MNSPLETCLAFLCVNGENDLVKSAREELAALHKDITKARIELPEETAAFILDQLEKAARGEPDSHTIAGEEPTWLKCVRVVDRLRAELAALKGEP